MRSPLPPGPEAWPTLPGGRLDTRAGRLVLAGALTDAVPLLRGRRYRLTFDGLGTMTTAPAR